MLFRSHIKRFHPQFVSFWRCQFVANDESSSRLQHSTYLTESRVDIIPKIDGLESGNNIEHFVVERDCRYICFVYFRPLLCYRMAIYFYRFLYTLGRVIDTLHPRRVQAAEKPVDSDGACNDTFRTSTKLFVSVARRQHHGVKLRQCYYDGAAGGE